MQSQLLVLYREESSQVSFDYLTEGVAGKIYDSLAESVVFSQQHGPIGGAEYLSDSTFEPDR